MQNFSRINNRGFVLIAVIILIIFVAIIVAGVAIFLNQRLVGYDAEQRIARCRYNSQAGINYAVYQYRQSGATYAAPTTVNIDANNSFVITSTGGGGGSGAAGSLVFDARSAALASGNRNIVNDTIQNTAGTSATINRITVTWTKTPKSITEFVINGTTVWSGSIATSPAVLTISPTFAIPASTTYPITRVRFNSSVAGDSGVTVSFRCTDSSTTTPCTAYPAQVSTCVQSGGDLTIRSMGRTTGSTLYKTSQATYNTTTRAVTAYVEQSTSVP
jgi:hypothetical protein